MNSKFYFITYIASVVLTYEFDFDFDNGKEIDKNSLNLVTTNDSKNVTISLVDKGYLPCYAILYSNNRIIGQLSCFFNNIDFEEWCSFNNPVNQYYLNTYFKKLFAGILEFKTKIDIFNEYRQIYLILGLIKYDDFKPIMTKYVKAHDVINRLDPYNESARLNISEKMDEQCDQNTIFYGVRYSDDSDDNLPNFKKYRLFLYELKKENNSTNDNATSSENPNMNTSDVKETKKNDEITNEKEKSIANDNKNTSDNFDSEKNNNDNNNKADTNKPDTTKSDEKWYDNDSSFEYYYTYNYDYNPYEYEYTVNNDKLSTTTKFKKRALDIIQDTILVAGVVTFIVFMVRFFLS